MQRGRSPLSLTITAALVMKLTASAPALAQAQPVVSDSNLGDGFYPTKSFTSHSNTGGILEAIQACHRSGSRGCMVVQSEDLVISSPQVIDLSAGGTGSLPVVIDSAGHSIECKNSSGTCLTFDGGMRTPAEGHTRQFIWRDFTIDGSSSAGSGLSIQNMTAGPIIQGRIQHFGSAKDGAQALTLSNVEDSRIDVTLLGNFDGLLLRNASNNNEILAWIDDGGDPLKKDPGGVALRFEGSSPQVNGCEGNTIRGLVQSNWGTRTVILGQGSILNTFKNVWFENNGDATPQTRLVTFEPSPGHYVINTRFESCDLAGGPWGKLGSLFSTKYASTLGSITMENNYSIGYAAFADESLASLGKFLGINEVDTIRGASVFYGSVITPNDLQTPHLTVTGPAPVVGQGQIGFGAKTAPASACGELKGAAGCLAINVDGKVQYLPYW